MVPIFQITGRAVWFVFSDLLTLFRLCWLPIGLLLATQYGLAYAVAHVSAGMQLEEMMETDAFAAVEFVDLLLQGLALSVIAVAVHRIILFGDRRPDQYFAFPFGKTEFLYVLMGGLSIAAILVLVGILGVGFAIVGTAAGADVTRLTESTPLTIAAVIVALIGYVALVWLALRLMVWPPAVVANNRLSFGEAWRLSKGNALALLALSIASSIAFIAIGGVVLIAGQRAGALDALDLGKALQFDDSIGAKLARLLEHRINPHVIAFEFAFKFFIATYTVAIISYAYKTLKGFDIDAPIDGQSDVDVGVELEPGAKPLGKL
ncbi:MAG: hypothetical protein KBA31_19685 [Alphaproteobacteria bacterium]|nr:hypothetical protein [Alphaproteobacteria bacterium]